VKEPDMAEDKNIFEDYINLLQLVDGDRDLLHTFGLKDESIETCKIKSFNSDDKEDIINELAEQYNEEKILNLEEILYNQPSASIFVLPNFDGTGQINSLLFLNEKLIGNNGEFYYNPFMSSTDDYIVLTIDIIDTLALCNLNIRCIALHKIPKCMDRTEIKIDFFDKLINILSSIFERQPYSRIILFFVVPESINELSLKKLYYQYFIYYLFRNKLKEAGFNSNIAVFPDQAVISLNNDEIRSILDEAIPLNEYFKNFISQDKMVLRKLRHAYEYDFHMPLRLEKNRYIWSQETKKSSIKEETISNFKINLKNTIKSSKTTKRIISFTDVYGNESDAYEISSAIYSSSGFRKFCFSKGNYIWNGNQKVLNKLWEWIFTREIERVIIEPDYFGKIKVELKEAGVSESLYLYKDCVIYENGEIENLNNDVVYKDLWGIKTPEIADEMPMIIGSDNMDIPLFMDLIQKNIGMKALLGIGFIAATLFSDEIFEKERCFPILFLFGVRGSGKTTYGHWLMRLAGYFSEGHSYNSSTLTAIIRSLSSRSNLPFWLDEFRNNIQIEKQQYFLNVYNREGKIKADRTSETEIIKHNINATLLLSGQETPKDSGIFSRCVILQFVEKDRDDTFYNDILDILEDMPDFTLQILQKQNEFREIYFEEYENIKTLLKDKTSDARISINYGIIAASVIALNRLFDCRIDEDVFIDYIIKEAVNSKDQKFEGSEIESFWEKVELLLADYNEEKIYVVDDDGKIYIWFAKLYDLYGVCPAFC
jgi:DNA primase